MTKQASKPNLNKLMRRIIATVEVPEGMREADCNFEREKLDHNELPKLLERFREKAIRMSADIEIFNLKVTAAVEVAQDEGAKHIEVQPVGYWNPSEVNVVGWFQPTEKELRRLNGTAKSLLTRKVQHLPKYQIDHWGRDIQNLIVNAFENADLEIAGLKKKEEFKRLVGVLRDKINARLDKLTDENMF